MPESTFNFVPAIGSKRAIDAKEKAFGTMYISTDEGKIYFDKSSNERILVGEKDAKFDFLQNVASKSWVIVHNLNKYPSATVIDSAGTEVEGDRVYDSLNQITINFSAEFCGIAHLS